MSPKLRLPNRGKRSFHEKERERGCMILQGEKGDRFLTGLCNVLNLRGGGRLLTKSPRKPPINGAASCNGRERESVPIRARRFPATGCEWDRNRPRERTRCRRARKERPLPVWEGSGTGRIPRRTKDKFTPSPPDTTCAGMDFRRNPARNSRTG